MSERVESAAIKYLSVCSGIEAATVAWHPLGWSPVAYSEIEAFPRAVLAHHYPDTPNWGDMTQFKEWPDANVDVLVGGTPCQSFSVAGLRKGLDDPRGNLMLTYLAIAAKYRVQWLVWENVRGVLSSKGGRDFGTFLGGLAELGYGWAYRVLDAQYFGLAQRRERVFVVGYLGDWHPAAAVLFERHSLQGHPAPRREARKIAAALTKNGVGACGADDNQAQAGHLIAMAHGQGGAEINTSGINPTLTCNHEAPILCVHGTQDPGTSSIAFALGSNSGQENAVFSVRTRPLGSIENSATTAVLSGARVRRLTPTECERLQGFPDNYTRIPWGRKVAHDCPGGPRYKALGNSMAVPVMRWIGERIALIDAITLAKKGLVE